jgi:hypothetical protein
MFADAIALSTRPQADPLRDGQILTGSGAAYCIFDVESDCYRLHLATAGWVTRYGYDRSGKNCACGASDDREADSAGRSYWQCRLRKVLWPLQL